MNKTHSRQHSHCSSTEDWYKMVPFGLRALFDRHIESIHVIWSDWPKRPVYTTPNLTDLVALYHIHPKTIALGHNKLGPYCHKLDPYYFYGNKSYLREWRKSEMVSAWPVDHLTRNDPIILSVLFRDEKNWDSILMMSKEH